MSRNVELSDDVYGRIEAEAAATGATVADWIAAHAPKGCAKPCPPAHTSRGAQQNAAGQEPAEARAETRTPPRTLADLFEGLIGVVSLERTDLSQRHSELFAEGMEEKHREGRL